MIGQWRDNLINLSGTNRLLNFKPSKSGSVEITGPSATEILAGLASGGEYRFRTSTDQPEQGSEGEPERSTDRPRRQLPALEPLYTSKESADLDAALRNLLRRSNQEYLDRGLWTLYLAFGSLTWADTDKRKYTSPLLLVPVTLKPAGRRQRPTLGPAEEDPVINPALSLKMSLSAITLPTVDDLEDLSFERLLSEVRDATAEQPEWLVNDTVTLSYFTFTKEAMYRDLLDNEAAIADHDVIKALAAGGRVTDGGAFDFDELRPDQIDHLAPPESTPLVLDADSSQRATVAAALAGHSFVMDGPPGTGKSQTIANMIGALLHAGKTVLFVSEKAAALEVVRNRLRDVGLDAYLLELHSRKATRKEVAAALGHALEYTPVAPAGMRQIDVENARRRREQLTAYAEAMNVSRQPLNYSLHDVLGMIAKLNDVPAAPATGIAPFDLTVERFNEVLNTAAALARAWRPASQGRSFTWRGVVEEASMDARLYAASSALHTLGGVAGLNREVAETLGVDRLAKIQQLHRILTHIAARPAGVREQWLTTDAFTKVSKLLKQLGDALRTISAAEESTTEAAGVPWHQLPAPDAVPSIDTTSLDALAATPLKIDNFTADEARYLLTTFAGDGDMLESRARSLAGLAVMLGMQPVVTYDDAEATIAVALLGGVAERPERGWLSTEGHTAAAASAQVLRQATAALRAARAGATPYFTDAVLASDVVAIAHRFTHVHRGLKKLGGACRADKRAVAALTIDGVDRRLAIERLGLAVSWAQAAAAFAEAESQHAAKLGAYYTGTDTDFDAVERALTHAATAIRHARNANVDRLAAHIAREATPNPDWVTLAKEADELLKGWRARLVPEPLVGARPELLMLSLNDAIAWLRGHLAPLAAAARVAQAVGEATGRTHTIGQARQLVERREAVDASHADLAGKGPKMEDAFGELFTGRSTDIETLRTAVTWAQAMRELVSGGSGPLTEEQVVAVRAAVPSEQLGEAIHRWTAARADLLCAFHRDRQAELQSDLDDFGLAADFIDALREDTAGQDEWFAYQTNRSALSVLRLDTAIDFCITERIPATLVPSVIERALLQEWADHHLKTDQALKVVRAEDRDNLVAEYRAVDKMLVGAANSAIINACNARRPRSDIGEAATIRREAGKKKKHMPVRTLLDRARHVTQRIKPCFMMSPLSVSQYLPSDMQFDVVIFDEASQVSPGDAINCIYRGRALITAGDQKQLPPTNFFGTGTSDDGEEWNEDAEDGGDFESILDLMKGSSAFRSLTLRWHYRSRHEALIAFSNSSFYDGRLITFPGAEDVSDDVGIEAFFVNGQYRRGSSRDNPVEAANVAERVIHHFTTRPHLSLGVVSFSEAQAAAIESAIDDARLLRPDLDQYFTDGRLDGFFVKNLESVQGDERDVMIFSIGYGPDEFGKTSMNFGPLNRAGGWRRLNVAITRARYRNEIVSSVRASDITASATSEGLRHLRRYLDYAERGIAALALETGPGGDAESPFEESVISALRSWGYEVTPQVGAAGYRIDIGVRHPDRPGVYVLGVECDGFQYHSSKVARDRDRLREQVLRGLGWRMHRIWGTAWYRNRHGEEERLRAAIAHAVAAPIQGLLSRVDTTDHIERPTVITEAASSAYEPDWAVPYVTATVTRLPSWVEPGEPGSFTQMIDGLTQIVTVEGPVHMTVIYQRLRDAWSIGRIGARIRDNIDIAIKKAKLHREGDFVRAGKALIVSARTPTDQCTRAVEQVHDDELSFALVNLVRDTGGIGKDDLTAHVARLYGWTRRGSDIGPRLDRLVNRLVDNGTLRFVGESITVAE